MEISVLVIEKDNKYLDMITGALERVGITVYPINHAGKALHYLDDIHPSLILLNLATEGTNGLEITKTIHSNPDFADVPILLLTVMEGKFNEMYTKNFGIVGFLKKPFSADDILDKVKHVLGIEDFSSLQTAQAGAGGEDEEFSAPGFDDEAQADDDFGSGLGSMDDGQDEGGADAGFAKDSRDDFASGTRQVEAFGPSHDEDPFSATLSLDAFGHAADKVAHGGHEDAADRQSASLPDDSPSLAAAGQGRKDSPMDETPGFDMSDDEFGTPFDAEPSIPPTPPARPPLPSKKKKGTGGKKMVLIGAGAILALVIAAAGIFFFTDNFMGDFIGGFMGGEEDSAEMTVETKPASAPTAPLTPGTPADETPAATTEAPPAGAPAAAPSKENMVLAEKKPATQTPSPAPKPREPKAEARAVEEIVETSPGEAKSGYYIQFGAFGVEANAKKLSADLRAEGLTLKVIEKDSLYRVVLDEAFSSLGAAEKKAKALKASIGRQTAVYQMK
jgi:CheY-like chemotaxis protein/cell division septation protein DedD